MWIVFLSHSDKDHINKLVDGIEKLTNTKIILVCGGEWFNSHSTEEIRELFGCIKKHQNRIFALFPYEDARSSTEDIVQVIYDKNIPVDKGNPESFNPKKLVNGVDLENIAGETFGDLFHTPTPGTQKGAYSHRRTEFWNEFLKDFNEEKKEILFNEVLQKIRIWSLDYRPTNTNAQSLVWSHEVDDLGWTFVYTGDAENSTFQKIQRVLKDSRKKLRNVLPDNNIIMLQLMHHGSKENKSDVAFDLFKPDACSISAGNGVAFAHPHESTIVNTRNKIRSEKFWNRYSASNPHIFHRFAAFKEKGDGKEGKAIKIKIKHDHPVILCPNISGTIRILKESISSPFTPIFGDYFMHDNHHAYKQESAKIIPETIEIEKLEKSSSYGNYPSELLGKIFKMSKGDNSIYTCDECNTYILKRIQKKYYYFYYIMEKLDDESDSYSRSHQNR